MKQGEFAELLFVQRVTFVKAVLHVLATQNISRWRLLPFAVVLIKALLRVRTMMASVSFLYESVLSRSVTISVGKSRAS